MPGELIYWRTRDIIPVVINEREARVYYYGNNISCAPINQRMRHCVIYLSNHMSCHTKANNYVRYVVFKYNF